MGISILFKCVAAGVVAIALGWYFGAISALQCLGVVSTSQSGASEDKPTGCPFGTESVAACITALGLNGEGTETDGAASTVANVVAAVTGAVSDAVASTPDLIPTLIPTLIPALIPALIPTLIPTQSD